MSAADNERNRPAKGSRGYSKRTSGKIARMPGETDEQYDGRVSASKISTSFKKSPFPPNKAVPGKGQMRFRPGVQLQPGQVVDLRRRPRAHGPRRGGK